MTTLDRRIDLLQALATDVVGRGAAVSLDPPGTRQSQRSGEWEATAWNKFGQAFLISYGPSDKEAVLNLTIELEAYELRRKYKEDVGEEDEQE